MIAQRVTSVSGSSEVFGYGFVTYWEQAKTRLVGVEPEVIAKIQCGVRPGGSPDGTGGPLRPPVRTSPSA